MKKIIKNHGKFEKWLKIELNYAEINEYYRQFFNNLIKIIKKCKKLIKNQEKRLKNRVKID